MLRIESTGICFQGVSFIVFFGVTNFDFNNFQIITVFVGEEEILLLKLPSIDEIFFNILNFVRKLL